jgi:hypothetical protein
MKTALTFVVVLVAGCGGKARPEADHPDEHGQMAPELAKFHDTLAPHWHAERGPQRMKDTCGAMAAFHADAEAVAKVAAPKDVDAATWRNETKELTDAVAALDATCQANDAAAFEPAFERVDKGFHGLLDTAGGK